MKYRKIIGTAMAVMMAVTPLIPEQYVSLASFPMLLFLAAVPLIMLWIFIIQLYAERNSSALSSRVLSWI